MFNPNTYEHADELICTVKSCIDILIDISESHGNIFPSLIDRKNCGMLQTMPPPLPGQRNHDRSHRGGNLMHDHPILSTMAAISTISGDQRYDELIDRYLCTFTKIAIMSESGLFPWGEHSFCDLDHMVIGNSYDFSGIGSGLRERPIHHDHLRAAPKWLWERLHALDSACVERFCRGLCYHFQPMPSFEYSRHGAITPAVPPYRNPDTSFDFPRHSGFYINDWAFAYSVLGNIENDRGRIRDQTEKLLDHWWTRCEFGGLLPNMSRMAPSDNLYSCLAVSQTLSLSVSLLDAAALIRNCDIEQARLLHDRGEKYLQSCLSIQPDLTIGEFYDSADRLTGKPLSPARVWAGGTYGQSVLSASALQLLAAYQHTRLSELLTIASAIGKRYHATSIPSDLVISAADAGMCLELMAALGEITENDEWIRYGIDLARSFSGLFFKDAKLPRAATQVAHYDSQTGTAMLVHGMARIALMAQLGTKCPLAAEFSYR